MINVGVLLSFSGGLEQWCSYIRQGVELAAHEEEPIQINVVYEDDHSVDRKSTATAAHKLIEIDRVDLLSTWTASLATVLAPIAANAKVPLLVGAYDHNVANAGPYVFGAFVNYDLVPRDVAQFFVKQRGATRLGLVMAADDWSQNFEKPFRDEAQKLGGAIVFSETVSPSEKEMRSLIVKLQKARVQAVLSPLYSSSLYAFLKQAREMKYGGIIHVGDGMFEEDIKIAGPSAEGVYASQIWVESEKLSSAFEKHFGIDANPLQMGLVASGYDWVKHLKGAGGQIIGRGQKISRETLREALKTFHSQGVLGSQMYGAPPAMSGEIIMVVSNGKYTPVNVR